MAAPIQSPGTETTVRRPSLTPLSATSQHFQRRASFDYQYTGPSVSASAPHYESQDAKSEGSAISDITSLNDEGVPTIYEKKIQPGRVKGLPDNVDHANGFPKPPNGRENGPIVTNGLNAANGLNGSNVASALPKRRRRDFFSTSKPVSSGRQPRSGEKTALRKIELRWSQEEEDGRQKILLNSCEPNYTSSQDAKNSVLWQHSNYDDIRLEELEEIMIELQMHGLQESEIGITKRLINRIRLVSQRSFIHGSFLDPIAMRYDLLDDSRYNKDKCSIFLDFPYFAIKRPDEKPSGFRKGAPEHPMRTLLQSRYRLNDTATRDESQCIREISGDKLKSCTTAPHQDTAHLVGRKVSELIYVPHLWALIIGLENMITAGQIDDVALHRSSLIFKEAEPVRRCSFVRISFLNRGVKERPIYPIAQCASWFGLLNVHQQLRSVLAHGKEKSTPKDFELQIGSHILTGSTWADVQRSTTSEVLSIWMDTPKLPAFSVQGTDGQNVKQQDEEESDTEPMQKTPVETTPEKTYKELDPVPIVKSFLEWQLVDDFGNRDESLPEVKVNRFLHAIYRSLSAVCASENVVTAPQANQLSSPSQGANLGQSNGIDHAPVVTGNSEVGSIPLVGLTGQSQPVLSGQVSPSQNVVQTGQIPETAPVPWTKVGGSGRLNISVIGRTLKDVDDSIYKLRGGEVDTIERNLRKEAVKLFRYYVPENHDQALAPVRLFWGLLHELINYGQHLKSLHDKIQEVNDCAKRLHLGVHYERSSIHDGRTEKFEDAISDYAILQATILNAFGAIFNMLVAAVKESRSVAGSNPEKKPWQRAMRHGNEACTFLEEARSKLIAEATGFAPSGSLGPVTTPEAIMILVLERLSNGVFGSGTVDVIVIFEECLEKLAFDVEKRPSRRLLKRLNAFHEEVSIIDSVLLQQHEVLVKFKKCLDPLSFKKPTTIRKIRYKFEEGGIERIITHIREQRRYCKELSDRAKVLEDQNVRLIETLADDNNRVILVFAIITIFFLPLSFVASFFGMNLAGISGTTSTTSRFWLIGTLLTAGIMTPCLIFVFKGEDVLVFFHGLPAACRRLLRLQPKEKLH